MKKTIFIIFLSLFLLSCSSQKSDNNPTIYVTITPLKALVEEITCGDFAIEVVVPEGASPESFEPTARHISAMSEAEFVFEVGLINFEQSLVKHLGDNLINLSEGIEPMAGCCSHAHHHGHHHSHGIDPHIWTAPRTLRTMVENARQAIMEHYPDSVKYESSAEVLLECIDAIDRRCAEKIKASDAHTMMIYHPAYTYFARDYSIEQIAIEQEGKEPTPRQLTALVERAKSEGINAIFLQPQYSADKVRAIAESCNAEIIFTDPLSKDILSEIERITDIICSYEPRDTH
ncbi:MAG: zinc ABC transporter substrate-binding protein [Alistipes sp.]|nr:zinc ABC transporter substrate-binding protein [Alistipes sp.]